ncbi:hypothetical protein AAY473_005842 [Plecturocebus cupreus]
MCKADAHLGLHSFQFPTWNVYTVHTSCYQTFTTMKTSCLKNYLWARHHGVLLYHLGWSAVEVHCNLHHLGSSYSPASASHAAGITGARQHVWLIFVFLVETGLRHVGPAGLELRPQAIPLPASQNTGITGMSHHVQPCGRVSLCHPGWSAVPRSWHTAASTSHVQLILWPQPPKELGLQACVTTPRDGVSPSLQRCCHVAQAGLKLLAQAILLLWPPKVLGLQCEPLHLHNILGFSSPLGLHTRYSLVINIPNHHVIWQTPASSQPSAFTQEACHDLEDSSESHASIVPCHSYYHALHTELEMPVPLSDGVSLLLSRLECNGTISANHNLHPPGSSDSPASASQGLSLSVAQARVQWRISAHYNLHLLDSSNSITSASRVAGITETGFHHVGQAGLELLTSGDPPALASQSARITGMSHCAGPRTGFYHVSQAGLELLTSKDLPTLASQSTGIPECLYLLEDIHFKAENRYIS